MTSQETYDLLKTAIDDAVSRKNYLTAISAAEGLGLRGGAKEHPTHLASYQYGISFTGGDEVVFGFASYDGSKTFDIRPDVNSFSLQLKRGGRQINSHSDSYND